MREQRNIFSNERMGDVDNLFSQLENQEFNFNKRDSDGNTLLIIAAGNDHIKIVNQSIEVIASVGIHDQEQASLILVNEILYARTEIVHYLLGVNVPVDLVNQNGNTALILAAEFGESEIVRQLIGAKASVDMANQDGNTALILAAKSGESEIVRQLIEAKASVDMANQDGETALMYAANFGRNSEIVRQLIEAKASVDMANLDGCTALMCAASVGGSKVVHQLIKAMATLDLKNKTGKTALDYAVKFEKFSVVHLLLSYNAVIQDHHKLYQFLVKKDGDVEITVLLALYKKISSLDENGEPNVLNENVGLTKLEEIYKYSELHNSNVRHSIDNGTSKKLPEEIITMIDEYNKPENNVSEKLNKYYSFFNPKKFDMALKVEKEINSSLLNHTKPTKEKSIVRNRYAFRESTLAKRQPNANTECAIPSKKMKFK